MGSDPNAPEPMEGEQEEGGDKQCQATAPSVETGSTRLPRSHSGGPAPRSSSLSIGLLVNQLSRRAAGSKYPAPHSNPIMTSRIEGLDRMLGRFAPHLTESRDARHLAFSSIRTQVLLMAQKLVRVESQLKSGGQIVGQEHDQIDDQVQILDQEAMRVQETFASKVADRLGETDN